MAITTSFTLARFNWSVAAITCIEIFEILQNKEVRK